MPQYAPVQYHGGNQRNTLLDFPDECPICHRHIAPSFISAVRVLEGSSDEMNACFRCTNTKCDRYFIAVYEFASADSFELRRTAPSTPTMKHFPATIEQVSPSFIEIYNQAIAAEGFGLNEIVGIGLRKALEFLVKDFAVSEHPGDQENIRRQLLSNVISSYIDDTRLKDVASRAAWLGNDETHYVRKWTDMDIEDMKRLVQLCVNWIDTVVVSNDYVASMPKSSR